MDDGSFSVDSTPEYTKTACNKSLSRLGLPNVDLYYVHRLDKVTPIEKTMNAMVELKNEGKFKYMGLSECSAESLRRVRNAQVWHKCVFQPADFVPLHLGTRSASDYSGTGRVQPVRGGD